MPPLPFDFLSRGTNDAIFPQETSFPRFSAILSMPPRTDTNHPNIQASRLQSEHNSGVPPGAAPQSTVSAAAPVGLGFHPAAYHHLPVSHAMTAQGTKNWSARLDDENMRRASQGHGPLSMQEFQIRIHQQARSSVHVQSSGPMQSNPTPIRLPPGYNSSNNQFLVQTQMSRNQVQHPPAASPQVTQAQSSGPSMQSDPYVDSIRTTLRECFLGLERNNVNEIRKLTEITEGRLAALDKKVDLVAAVQVDGFKAILGKMERLEKVVGVKEARKANSRTPTVGADGGRDDGGGGVAEGSAKASNETMSVWARLDSIECDVLELLERIRDPQAGSE